MSELPRVQFVGRPRAAAAWLPLAVATEYFALVEHRPDFQIIVVREPTWPSPDTADLDLLERGVTGRARQVVISTVDRWDGATAWHDRFRALIAASDTIVFGPQLPVSSPFGDRLHPLLYPSMIELVRPTAPVSTHDIDLIFIGDFADESAPTDYAGPPPIGGAINARSRLSRGHALDLLRRELGHRRLLIERRDFWGTLDDDERMKLVRLIVSYRRALMRASVCFSPPGKGYNCVRHSDILAIGGLLLTSPIHNFVRLPEPSAWAAEEICVHYATDCSNLVEIAERAIASSAGLQARRDAAHAYYGRVGTARARAHRIASVLAAN